MSKSQKSRFIGFTILILAVVAIALLFFFGKDKNQPKKTPLAVMTIVAKMDTQQSAVTPTGEIQARVQSDLSFRTAGRILERYVEVGDHVKARQALAALDATQQKASLEIAKAGLQAAQALLAEKTTAFERQKSLLKEGYTTQPKYDDARQALVSAQTTLDSAKATVATEVDNLKNAILRADNDGIITARYAEKDQVINPAQAVFTLAADGERDAVFNVYESLFKHKPKDNKIEVILLSDPSVKAVGEIREVSPTVDPASGTVKVKFSIQNTPPEMRLGAAVTGLGYIESSNITVVPWTAFFTDGTKPAVWVVDPKTRIVKLTSVSVLNFTAKEVMISSGLRSGDQVVIAGGQLLQPGQKVAPRQVAAGESRATQ